MSPHGGLSREGSHAEAAHHARARCRRGMTEAEREQPRRTMGARLTGVLSTGRRPHPCLAETPEAVRVFVERGRFAFHRNGDGGGDTPSQETSQDAWEMEE